MKTQVSIIFPKCEINKKQATCSGPPRIPEEYAIH